MKIIFLDIDGVLNCRGSKSKCGYYTGIDSAKVKLLKQIVDATNAVIVLSSTWRLGYNRSGHQLEHHAVYMKRKLEKEHLHIYDVTKDFGACARAEEILDYLKDKDVESFVILDDEDWEWNKYNLESHWVESTFDSNDGGIHQEHVDKAIKILNGE